MEPIRTKLHKLRPLVEAGELYFTACDNEGGKAKPVEEFGYKLENFSALLLTIERLPKFVIDTELLEIAKKTEYDKSLVAMRRAGVFRLPYSEMLIEFQSNACHYFILLLDLQSSDIIPPWYNIPDAKEQFGKFPLCGIVIRLHQDEHGQYVVLAPSISYLDIDEEEGVNMIKMTAACIYGIDEPWTKTSKLIEETFKKDAMLVWHGVIAAMLLMNTGGVERKVIDPQRLNKKRAASNKPLIPRHTYIYIGHVYRSIKSDVADEYVPRKSPRPHWRRGHNRGIRFGEGRQKFKVKYIPGKLVALHPGDPEPAMPEYRVKM